MAPSSRYGEHCKMNWVRVGYETHCSGYLAWYLRICLGCEWKIDHRNRMYSFSFIPECFFVDYFDYYMMTFAEQCNRY